MHGNLQNTLLLCSDMALTVGTIYSYLAQGIFFYATLASMLCQGCDVNCTKQRQRISIEGFTQVILTTT